MRSPTTTPKVTLFCFVLVLCSCGSSKQKAADLDATMGPAAKAETADVTPPERVKPKGQPLDIKVPLGLPPLPSTPSPMTDELVALGRRLFYEGSISADSVISCASCHGYDHAFAETRQVSMGFGGARSERNSPSLLNVAYWSELNWDGSAQAVNPPLGVLESQVKFPLEDPAIMATKAEALEKNLNINDEYHAAMQKVYGKNVTIKYLLAARAIAAFERTLLSGNSPFDRYLFGKQENAISSSAIHGWAVFSDPQKGNCIACHTVGQDSALFTDNQYHNIGVGLDSTGEGRDLGRFKVTNKPADRGAFRTPSLRNVAMTPPYMHNGSIRSLRGVVDFYAEGGNLNPNLDPKIKRLNLTEKEKDDLVIFLETLTGEMPVNTGRPSLREISPSDENPSIAAPETPKPLVEDKAAPAKPKALEQQPSKPSPFTKK